MPGQMTVTHKDKGLRVRDEVENGCGNEMMVEQKRPCEGE